MSGFYSQVREGRSRRLWKMAECESVDLTLDPHPHAQPQTGDEVRVYVVCDVLCFSCILGRVCASLLFVSGAASDILLQPPTGTHR